MVRQLRIYTINKGKFDEFVAGWTRFVYPLHREFGFRIELAEKNEETNEFVWIVAHDGTMADWEARQREYYGSPQRAAVDPDPARLIAKTQRWFINSVLPNG